MPTLILNLKVRWLIFKMFLNRNIDMKTNVALAGNGSGIAAVADLKDKSLINN